MADQTKNTIVSELDERLDSLFGEDVGDLDALEGSPLEGLKSLVMTIDWEISEGTLNALQEELNSLRSQYAGSKPVSILLKMMTSLAGYIQKRKGGSHPESIQLFHAVAKDLTNIVEQPGMDPRARNALVKKDIDRFQSLKSEIAGAGKQEAVAPSPEPGPVVEEPPAVFEPVSEAREAVSTFEPEPTAVSEPEPVPSAPPVSEEYAPTPEGTIEFEKAGEPQMESQEQAALEAETPEVEAPPVGEEVPEAAEEDWIPEYEMEETSEEDLERILEETSETADMPEVGVAQEISESTMEDLEELDEIFKEELSRVQEPLEEPGFEPIPSPEELGITVDLSAEDRLEDTEPVLMEEQEELTEVFDVSEEPMEEMDSLFAERPSAAITEAVTPEPERPEPSLDGGAASLQPILEAIRSLGRELRSGLNELRSEVHETKERLNRLLEYQAEFPTPGTYGSPSRGAFDVDFESGEDEARRLFSDTAVGEEVPTEAEKGLDFEEASLEDIFRETETASEGQEQQEETKTLQELFEEAVAPETDDQEKTMDFEFEGEDSSSEISEEREDVSEEAGPDSGLEPDSDFVTVTLAGREYTVPAEYVLKTGKIKGRARTKVLKSGFAAMDDLRGPFQSLRKDIFPAWEHLSQKELRQLVFPVLTADVGDSGDQAEGRGFLLLMRGDRCGMLFTDDVPLRVGAEEAKDIESLDVERLFSSVRSS